MKHQVNWDRYHALEAVLYNYRQWDYVLRLHLVDTLWWRHSPLRGVDIRDEEWWQEFALA